METSCSTIVAYISSVLTERCGPLLTKEEYEANLNAVFAWSETVPERVLRELIRRAAGYQFINGVAVSPATQPTIRAFKKAATQGRDKVGLVEEEKFKKVDAKIWTRKYRSLLVKACSFFVMPGDVISVRKSNTARLKAAVKVCGPATKEEIAHFAGVPYARVDRDLWSTPGVCKQSHKLWALEETVDRPYKGVVEEIKYRIHQDNGSTTVSRIMKELPELYDVSEISVSAFLHTPQFVIEKGSVSLRPQEEIKLKRFEDAIDGREVDGSPYWDFLVLDRYLKGYTAAGFRPELARYLGCEPNGRMFVPVHKPDGCRDLSVTWRLSSTNGVQVGYLNDVIKALDAVPGETLRLVVRLGHVEIHRV